MKKLFLALLLIPLIGNAYQFEVTNLTNDIYYPKVLWAVEDSTSKVLKSSVQSENSIVAGLLNFGATVNIELPNAIKYLVFYNGAFFYGGTAENMNILLNSALTVQERTQQLLDKKNSAFDALVFFNPSTSTTAASGGQNLTSSYSGWTVPSTVSKISPIPGQGAKLVLVPKGGAAATAGQSGFTAINLSDLGQYWPKWVAELKPALTSSTPVISTFVTNLEEYAKRLINHLKSVGLPTTGLEQIQVLIDQIKARVRASAR